MKKSLIIFIAIVFMAAPILSFGQSDTTIINNEKKEKKISFSFINEYGLYAGGTIGFAGIFVNGFKINKTQDLIGIGTGYEIDSRTFQNMPIFVNYRHYFNARKKIEPLLNLGIGTRLAFEQYQRNNYDGDYFYDPLKTPKIKVTPGIYATLAAGFKVKAFTFTSGAFLKSYDTDFFAGFEIKTGFTF
jgi:hypothetical protein